MPTARTYAATGAIDGKFYVVTGQLTTAVEVYDPALNTWTSKAPIPTNRSQAATGTIDGKLYVVGGAINSDPRIGWTNVLEMYDPATNSWTTKTPMTTARLAMVSGVIGGKLYVAGGMQSCGVCTGINTLEVYDPATNTWTTKASMPTARAQMGGAVINGKLYVVGGSTGNTTPLAMLEVYDPATDSWTTKAPMPTPRLALGAGEVNGILYAVSGLIANSVQTKIVEAYDPATDTWTSVDAIPTSRYQSKPQGINGALYMAGSGPGGAATSTLEVYTPATVTPGVGAWTQLSPSGSAPKVRDLHTAAYNPTSNRMIVFAGLNGPGMIGVEPLLNDVWVLTNADGSSATPAWTQLSPTGGPPRARGYHAAVYDAANNRMVVYAGDPSIGYCSGAINDVWVLTNADGTGGTPSWTQLSPSGGPPELRQDPKAVYDPASNRMIVFGGRTNACGTNSNATWVLSNANGLGGTPVWTQLAPTGAAPAARANHTVAYDSANNRMLVFGGGTATSYVNDVWVLANANGLGGTPVWSQLSPTGGPPSARIFSTVIFDPVTNHLVLFDGLTGAGHANDVWILENANGLAGTPRWVQSSATGTPPSARSSHTAVINSSTNRMITFGGRTCTGGCSASEYLALNDVWVLPLGAASAITVPGAPAIVGTNAGNAQVTLSFSAPSSNGGATITGYTASCSASGQPLSTSTGNSSPITVTGLTNGASYTCYVTATNSAGASNASASSSPFTPAAPIVVPTAPGPPTGVSATASNTQALVSFSAPSSNGGAAISYYTVTASPGGQASSGSISPIAVTGLTNDTSYTFTVTATNSVGTSAPSSPSNAVTPVAPQSVPGAPTSVSATAGNAQATISFSPPSNSGGSSIAYYTVTASPGGRTANGTTSPIVVTGLTNGNTYAFTVSATNATGTSIASSTSISVTPLAVPDVPTNVTATAGNAQAIVNFSPPAANGGATIVFYTVTASPGGLTANGSGSSITLTGLTNGTSYTFTVTATNSAGTSAPSSPSNTVTPIRADTLPGPPTITSAVASNASIAIAFAAPSTTGSTPITGYIATCNPDGISKIGSTSPITVTGLINDTTYSCVVSASNSAGTGPASSSASAKPTGLASASLSKTTLSFGSTNIGSTSVNQSVILSNTGNSLLTINSIAVNGDFSRDTTCSSNLAGGGSCTILVYFTPTASGTRAGTLSVSSNASGTLSVSLSGTGTANVPRLSALSVSGVSLLPSFSATNGSYTASVGNATSSTRVTASTTDAGASISISGTSIASGSPSTAITLSPGVNTISVKVTAADGVTSTIYSIVITRLTPLMSAGLSHSLALKDDGSLWAWGYNSSGQLGDNSSSDSLAPKLVGQDYSAIAAGHEYSLAVKKDGSVWAWGNNDHGQLGDATTVKTLQPKKIVDSGYTTVAAGFAHSLGLMADGSLWAWGNNEYGQLGNGTVIDKNSPQRIGTGFKAIATGQQHTLALKTDGSLYAWGRNDFGQLGDSTTDPRYEPKLIGGNFQAIAAAGHHSLALKTDGSLYAWGWNSTGQLGDGTTSNRSTPYQIGSGYMSIAPGFQHSLALKTDGGLWAWGYNGYGQLGDGSTANILSPRKVGSGYLTIAAGYSYSLAPRSDGTVLSGGHNLTGQLGDGTLASRPTPVLVVNDSVDNALDLIPSIIAKNIPADKIPSFWAKLVKDSSITATLKYDSTSLNQQGNVYVVAYLSPDSQLLKNGPAGMAAPKRLHAYANTSLSQATNALVPAILTRNGWKQVTASTVTEPLYTGKLDDANNTFPLYTTSQFDLASEPGIICAGYATSAGTSAKGVIRSVVTGKDASMTDCPPLFVTTPATTTVTINPGWNLIGNGTDASLFVGSSLSDTTKVTSVWSWVNANNQWAFYSPSLSADDLSTYAASKGLAVLDTIRGGEGFWINAKQGFTLTLPTGNALTADTNKAKAGWNLMAIGETKTPAQFNTAQGNTVISLWTWDNARNQWYFYAPSLAAAGAMTLTDFINGKGYLDFTTYNKNLGQGVGVWVSR